MKSNRNTIGVLAILILLLASCSSKVPPVISNAMPEAPSLAEVRAQPVQFRDQQVRWGGVIVSTENLLINSRIKIVAFPLNDRGRPQITKNSLGRFIAFTDQFLEPLVYSRDREITVTGRMVGSELLKVGEYDYEYPLVQIENFHLWPTRVDNPNPEFWPHYPYYPYYRWPHNFIPYHYH